LIHKVELLACCWNEVALVDLVDLVAFCKGGEIVFVEPIIAYCNTLGLVLF